MMFARIRDIGVLSLMVLTVCAGCRIHVMDARLVSVTTDRLPSDWKGGAPVEEEWCVNEAPEGEDLGSGPGYLDHLLKKAQKKHRASYFADVSFYQAGRCVEMTGRPVK